MHSKKDLAGKTKYMSIIYSKSLHWILLLLIVLHNTPAEIVSCMQLSTSGVDQ